ncbi:MAG TPA: 3-dehydroquinate synthase [Anseongella sp.]
MQTFIVNSDGYKVYIGNSYRSMEELLSKKKYAKTFVLVDTNTSEKCLPKFREKLPSLKEFDIIEIDAGEAHKNIDYCVGIWKMLLDFGAGRDSLLINLGGGMVTDMGSFAASTYKRGIDFIQVPTTLLSQVDASVGGKTGIDIDNVKNIIGTFANPLAVCIDTDFLYTLPRRELLSGFAEMIKHGLIFDSRYYFDLQTNAMSSIDNAMIFHSVNLKNKIVLEDPTERNIRKALNFGHTIGHAVESYSLAHDKDPLLHGEAIAIGMICEAWLSHQKTGLEESALIDIRDFLLAYYPSYVIPEEAFPELTAFMQKDKKNEAGKINFTLLESIGEFVINQTCTEEELRKSLAFYTEHIK